ncbi:iron uptake porin [Spirulina sp. CS-785/01]|uniref:iron uptake porin n=1 Tax=Spirulina sp. CS-785/01 TaxID=3021716 RepID=UPI00232DE4C1|nr:iron uptake porin [Spirulina sp. CS-785/01]MDB9314848.1 iron uptake porin [Spirulina sp. CS-785/01]
MEQLLRTALFAAPATLGVFLGLSSDAIANPPSSLETLEEIQRLNDQSQGQFTGASQFRDVSPGDWAFQALDDLVRRYDCLKGYPDGTYRGNRALSRYEFAAGLNACLQQMERILAEATADLATREDLETLRRLMQEFEAELATLGTRVDNLEGRVTFLEDHQFSTTTKLNGGVVTSLDVATGDRAKIYGFTDTDYNNLAVLNNLADTSAVNPSSNFVNLVTSNRMIGLFEGLGVVDSTTLFTAFDNGNPLFSQVFLDGIDIDTTSLGDGEELDTIVTNFIDDLDTIHQAGNSTAANFNRDGNDSVGLGYRLRLNFDTSFFGQDRLRTRLQARNLENVGQVGTGTPNTDPNLYGDSGNDVQLSKLWYRFPVNENLRLHIAARGIFIDEILDAGTTSPYAYGNLPLGLAYNQQFYDTFADGNAAVGANFRFSDLLRLDIGYFAVDAPNANTGIFGGEYYLPVQLSFDFSDKFKLAVGYGHGFSPGGARVDNNVSIAETASVLGKSPFLWVNNSGNIQESATTINTWHLSASWDVAESVNLSTFVGYTNAVAESGVRFGDTADLWTWAFNLGFPDLWKEGDVITASFGQLPSLTRAGAFGSTVAGPSDRDATYLASLEYRFPLNDKIQVAPGAYAVFNPNGNSNNDTIFVGMLRTVLSF